MPSPRTPHPPLPYLRSSPRVQQAINTGNSQSKQEVNGSRSQSIKQMHIQPIDTFVFFLFPLRIILISHTSLCVIGLPADKRESTHVAKSALGPIVTTATHHKHPHTHTISQRTSPLFLNGVMPCYRAKTRHHFS